MRKIYILLLLSVFLISACGVQNVPPTGQATKSPDAVVYVDLDNNGVVTESDRKMTVSPDEFGNYEIRVVDRANMIIPASTKIIAKEEESTISITAQNGGVIIGDSAKIQSKGEVIISAAGDIKIGMKAKLSAKSSLDFDAGGDVGQIAIGDGTTLKAPFIYISNFFGRGPIVGNKVKIQTEDLTFSGFSNVLITNSIIKLGSNGYSSFDVNTPGTGYAIDLSGTSFSGKDYSVFGYGTPSNTATTRFRGKPSYISFE